MVVVTSAYLQSPIGALGMGCVLSVYVADGVHPISYPLKANLRSHTIDLLSHPIRISLLGFDGISVSWVIPSSARACMGCNYESNPKRQREAAATTEDEAIAGVDMRDGRGERGETEESTVKRKPGIQ